MGSVNTKTKDDRGGVLKQKRRVTKEEANTKTNKKRQRHIMTKRIKTAKRPKAKKYAP